ncbi:obtusifoliol 14-alpha demethylase-like [Lolium rigidum]|uniref:obtusifoliol 14-alpha demethylase-like n=1 Tax=Lolium rigidum TaxID=89674 RepID=UPI001F5DCE83|nr:obtusifoliol 14-alpha demethylase-like [Lolium rigidum]
MEFPGTWCWCGAVALVSIIITVLSTKSKNSRARHPAGTQLTPPLVSGTDLLQLIPTLLKKGGLPAVFTSLYVKYGSVFRVSLFGFKMIFLAEPEVTPHFYHGLDSEISHGDLYEFTVPIFGPAIGLGRDIATRNEQKRFHFDALKPSRLAGDFAPMLQEVESYFAKWGKEGIVDLKFEFDRLVMLMACRCFLGEEVRENMFDEIDALFRELAKGMKLASILFPYLPTPLNRSRDRARIRLTEILSDVVETRKRSGKVRDDTLQRFIDSRYKDGSSTTVEEVVGMTISLLFAGKHNSSVATIYSAACLLTHPTYLKAVIEEQEQIAKKYKDGIDFNAVMEMEMLHNCMKETIRMHPPSLALVRKAHLPFTVQTKEGKQYEIPKDHPVSTLIHVNNYIPYIYKDPHVYDPYRFGPERKEDIAGGKLSFMSFGAGRHVCIGEGNAYLQMKLIWSHLLRNFELELISPFPETDWSNFVGKPKGNLFVRYKRIGSAKSV